MVRFITAAFIFTHPRAVPSAYKSTYALTVSYDVRECTYVTILFLYHFLPSHMWLVDTPRPVDADV